MLGNLFKRKKCRDELQLLALEKSGADLSQPQIINFLFDSDKVETARAIAEELSGKGFQAQIILSDDGQLFTCKATKELIPELALLRSLTQELALLAQQQGCVYNSWEAEITE
ncbi:ribonuclease E inhibitor RraB [Pseudomonadota bacterium]